MIKSKYMLWRLKHYPCTKVIDEKIQEAYCLDCGSIFDFRLGRLLL